HWFIELAGRMLLLPDWKSKVIYTDLRYPFQREFFAMQGVTPERLISMDWYSLYQFKSLSVPFWPHYSPAPHSYRALQEMAGLPAVSEAEKRMPKHIYFSRGDIKGRRDVENEREIQAVLDAYGFTGLHCSSYSLQDQIRLARNAECIVFPHGAAGLNLVFARPGTVCVELMPPGKVRDNNYLNICQGIGHHYYRIVGTNDEAASEQANFHIPPDLLERTLAHILGSPAKKVSQ
ncbi:glycosyltransferase family 61 protein, partial [Desulfovibrio sp. OttesenSCG-928-G15]|nr:glycosyltransferase family 61 protein [Desulfovibrio sp. OttesenSCG-928-G15]